MRATPILTLTLLSAALACGADADQVADADWVADAELVEHEQPLLTTPVASASTPFPLDLELTVPEYMPLCWRGLVARYLSQPIQAVAPSTGVMCEYFPTVMAVSCNTLSPADQLDLIDPGSYSREGFRMHRGDFQAFVDVPIPRGKTSLYAQELTDLAVRYEVLYDLANQTWTLSAGTATPGNIMVVDDAGHIEQEIPIPAFPRRATNRRVRLTNSDRYNGRFLSRIYVRGWECVSDEPYNP